MSKPAPRNFRDTKRTFVTSLDELPDFAELTREQEAEWWESHDLADELFEEGPEVDAEVYEALGFPEPEKRS